MVLGHTALRLALLTRHIPPFTGETGCSFGHFAKDQKHDRVGQGI